MKSSRQNLFSGLPTLVDGEDFPEVMRCRNLVIERMPSGDTPDTGFYDQEQDEWVLLIELLSLITRLSRQTRRRSERAK